MGELRGGYIPGNLSPEEQAQAEQRLYEHVMGNTSAEAEPTERDEPPADEGRADQ